MKSEHLIALCGPPGSGLGPAVGPHALLEQDRSRQGWSAGAPVPCPAPPHPWPGVFTKKMGRISHIVSLWVRIKVDCGK